jgi:hypothetical protein
MKSIELKRLGPEPIVDYAEVLSNVIKRPLNPQAGADIAEMKQSLRVLDALEKANGVLELEDADWEHLKLKLRAQPWNVIDQRIVDLVDEVDNAR